MSNKITTDELKELFGDEIPIEAFKVLAEPGSLSVDQVRARLVEINISLAPRAIAKRALFGRLWSWIEEHDLRHSEACEIAYEVLEAYENGEVHER